MKQIVFYETRVHYYGYTTIETDAKFTKGSEIRKPDGMTLIVIATLPATHENYLYAKKLLGYSGRHNGLSTFKYNLERL